MSLDLFKRRKRHIEPDKIEFQPTILYKPVKIQKRRSRISINISIPKFFWGIFALILIILVTVAIYNFVRDPYFSLKEFKVLGNRNTSTQEIIDVLKDQLGRHLYIIETSKMEQRLLDEFPIIDGVDIHKLWPDRLFIKISEREPRMVYVNLNGSYLVDDEGRILEIIAQNEVDFDDDKIRIARGYGSIEDEAVKKTLENEFIAKLGIVDETEIEIQNILLEQFKYEIIPLSDKERVVNYLRELYLSEAESFWSANSKLVDLSKYSSFPRVKVLNNNELLKNDEVDLDRLNLTIEVINFTNQKQIPVVDIIWEGELLVKVETLEQRYLIFGLNRKSSIQFEDLLIVLQDLAKRGKSYTVIDVSATKVLVVH